MSTTVSSLSQPADRPLLTEDGAELERPAGLPTPEYSLAGRLGAEVFGTFVLVFIGVGIALFSAANTWANTGIAVPLGFGIAVLGAASAVGHVSGGHFNPAVSLGAAIAGRIAWRDLLPYWVAQLVGGAVATALLFALVPSSLPALLGSDNVRAFFSGTSNGFGEHSPLSIASSGQTAFGLLPALLIEIVATAVFVGVILGVTDKRANIGYAPAAIGLTLAVLLIVAAPITNASLNPARSTATAIFSSSWAFGQLWVFWVAPLLGGVIAALVYRIVTPAPEVEGNWPETEPTELEEIEEEQEAEAEADAIDALLARRSQAAAVPAGPEAVVTEAVVAEPTAPVVAEPTVTEPAAGEEPGGAPRA